MFLSRGDSDLGVAFQTHPGSQSSTRGEAKDPALLLSPKGVSWSPLSGLKGVKHPVEFGERTQDCYPGHAGKEGLHLAMTEAYRGFSRAGEPVWDFSRGMTGSSGSLSCGAREVRSPCAWRGGARPGSRVTGGDQGLETR